MRIGVPTLAVVSLFSLSSCASVDSPAPAIVPTPGAPADTGRMIPAPVPMPVKTLEVWDATKQTRVEKDVWAMTADDIREHLTSTEALIAIEKIDSSGGLTYLGAGGKVARGSYRVTFDFVRYTDQKVTFTNKTALGRMAVGLRITATLQTASDNVDLGGLLPIGLAAQQSRVSGSLSFRAYGIANNKVAAAVPTQSMLDIGSIQKSFEAAATVRALIDDAGSRLEPYLIGVADVNPSDAKAALDAATKALAPPKS